MIQPIAPDQSRSDDALPSGPPAETRMRPAKAPSSESAIRDPGRQIDSLTGLRALAAWHVVVFHVGGCFSPYLPAAAQRFIDDGESAVSLFFVLSGFVLAYVYLGNRPHGRFDVRKFYWARFSRVYPLYLFTVVIAAPLAVAAIGSNEASAWLKAVKCLFALLANVTLMQAWHPRLVYAWNLPAWSLSAEAFFYLLFPLMAWATSAFARKTAVGIAACLAIYVVSLALPMLVYAVAPSDANASAVAKFNPLVRLPEFILGVAVGQMWINSVRTGRCARAAAGWLAAGAAVLIVAAKCIPPIQPFTHPNSGSLLYGLLIWALAHQTGLLHHILSSKPLVLLGEASYATYLLHLPLWLYWQRLIGDGAMKPSIAQTAVYMGGLLTFSIGAYLWIERPVRDWLRQRSPTPWQRAAA